MDRISNLPDEINLHIGSFLSAKEAALTKICSKRWKNLFTIESDLVFDHSIHGSFKVFVDGLLARYASDRVRRFSLRLRPANLDSDQYKLVNKCMCNVLKRGVTDLELDINADKEYALPSEVFTCSTVEKLKLGSGFVIDFIPKDALLPALNTLLLDSVRFYSLDDGCVFQRLGSACPVLEELVIDGHNCEDWNWSQIVSSQILNRLTIRRKDRVEQDGSSYAAISFDTPSLEYLEYSDLLRDEYPVVDLNSLVEAKLNLPLSYAPENYDVRNLVMGLKNVHIMSLDYVETMQLFDAVYQVIPKFDNLCHLSISTQQNYCCYGLELLVRKSPNLKTLTIKELHYQYQDGQDWRDVCECLSGYSFLKSCPIETLTITDFQGRIGEMVQMKLILQNLLCVELLEVHVQVMVQDREKVEILSQLLRFPRASNNCEVQVMFS